MHHRIIDDINIYQATLSAMKRALMQLLAQADQRPSVILIDAMPLSLDHIDIPVVHFPYGERQSASIAAASIIAKVTRDALMARLDKVLPGYVFQENKGYGTAAHKKGLKEHGTSLIHRMSFKWEKNLANQDLLQLMQDES
jgi:ribonuclease HII